MSLVEKITEHLEPAFTDMGFGIVLISLTGQEPKKLEVLLERLDDTPITLADCAKANREAGVLLDVADWIKFPYVLEVSSPGLDRPLVRERDYERFQNHEVQLKTTLPIEGQKKFKGILRGLSAAGVHLEITDQDGTMRELKVPMDIIKNARLVPDLGQLRRKR